jgi:multiple sugar transport system substrate-binding protein
MQVNKRTSRITVALVVVVCILLGSVSIAFGQDGGTLSIWTKFNADNPQVASDRWLSATIEDYAATSGVTLENTFVVYNEINTRLNVAVQSGGQVPDVSYVDSQNLGFYLNNGTLTDLTEFVTSAEWFDDLDPIALQACTTPTGEILCVPTTTTNFYTYYWTDIYPDGYPTTTDEFLAMAPSIREQGYYPITFKGAEGAAVERFYYPILASYGAQVVDAEGRATWANDQAVEAVEFIRALFTNDYVPQVSLAPGFEFEEPFKQGQAGGFVAGTFSYVYLTPLVAPSGERFEEAPPAEGFDENAIAVGDAFDAGELAFAPPLSAPGSTPRSMVLATAWAIPFGSGNVEGAMDFINYQMTTQANIDFAVAYGALPTVISAANDPVFSGTYWQTSAQYQAETGIAAPAWTNYDEALRLLSTAIVNVVTNPDADIMPELMLAQDEYNLGLE